MRRIIVLFITLFCIAHAVHAQSTAEQVLPGFLSSNGVFVPYSVGNPLPVSGAGGSIPAGAGQNGAPTCRGYTDVVSCEQAMRYVDVRLHGAVCVGNAVSGQNDTASVLNGDVGTVGTAAYNAKLLGVAIYINNLCGLYSQVQLQYQNETIFGDVTQTNYSASTLHKPNIYVNTNSIQTNATVNAIFQLNNHQGFSLWNFNANGDGLQSGTSLYANNQNSTNADGTGQAPTIEIHDSSVTNIGSGGSCPTNNSGAPVDASCGYVTLLRVYNYIVSNSALGLTGNLSDLRGDGLTLAGDSCGGILLAAGAPSMDLRGVRIEGTGQGFGSGECPAGFGGDALTVNGDRWQISGLSCENIGGNCITFASGYSRPEIVDSWAHNVGQSLVANHRAVFAWNGSNASVNKGAKISNFHSISDGAGNQQFINDFQSNNDTLIDETNIGTNGGFQSAVNNGTLPAGFNFLSADDVADSQAAFGSVSGTTVYVGTFGGGYNFQLHNGFLCGIAGFAFSTCFDSPASTINRWILHGSATGNDLTVTPETGGSDANTGFSFNPNGSGHLKETGNPVFSLVGTGLSKSGITVSSNAEQTISFQPGLITSITATKSVFGKFVKASTVDNIEGSAFLFSCVSNPTITLFECGTSVTCSSTPVTIGTVTVTTAGTVVDGTVSNAAIAAGDYIAWALTAGTCTSLDISATAQVHSN